MLVLTSSRAPENLSVYLWNALYISYIYDPTTLLHILKNIFLAIQIIPGHSILPWRFICRFLLHFEWVACNLLLASPMGKEIYESRIYNSFKICEVVKIQ